MAEIRLIFSNMPLPVFTGRDDDFVLNPATVHTRKTLGNKLNKHRAIRKLKTRYSYD